MFISLDTAVLFIFTGLKLCKNCIYSTRSKTQRLSWDTAGEQIEDFAKADEHFEVNKKF